MRLFALGSNGSGQLGLGHAEDVSIPTQCLFQEDLGPDETVIKIVAGGNHTLLLTNKKHVYAAGCNTDGRCGPVTSDDDSQDVDNLLTFRRVILTDCVTGVNIDTFTTISATWEGSVLVAAVPDPSDQDVYQDKVFVMGSSPKGELGLEWLASVKSATKAIQPGVSIPDFPPSSTQIVALASGMGHSVAILSNGHVYGWGGSRKGQLGDSLKGEKVVWTPTEIQGLPFAAQTAVCGREFTVICGDRSKGELVVLGDKANRWGVLNVPVSLQLSTPDGNGKTLMPFSDIGASWHGIYVHAISYGASDKAQSNRLMAWGRNDRGQLPPEDFPSPVKMAVGSEHVVTLMDNGIVAAFGWGEHGNCGTHTDDRGNVTGQCSQIPLTSVMAGGGRVTGLGAGCATSWIIAEY